MAQQLKFSIGEMDVDKQVDPKHPGIEYIGKAILYMDGTAICLASLNGILCRVEIRWK